MLTVSYMSMDFVFISKQVKNCSMFPRYSPYLIDPTCKEINYFQKIPFDKVEREKERCGPF